MAGRGYCRHREKSGTSGCQLKRYPGMPQDDLGIMQFPGGARVAWFQDSDGNVLSVTQL
jgi:hypothetical protein